MRFNKKAALELSITAIVVLIIAITVLGLGIGFIKKLFGAGTEQIAGELSKIKEQIKEQVRTGGELLVFSVPEEVQIGKPKDTFVGVRNTADNTEGDRVCFRVEVKCIKPFTPDSYCDPRNQRDNIAVGGYDMTNNEYVSGNNNWFKSILGEFDLKDFEGDVYDAEMLVRGVKPDSYAMEINVYKAIQNSACEPVGSPQWQPAEDALYASKTFVLNVV